MSETIELQAELRSNVGSGIKALRRSGKTPAVIYGRHVTPLAVQLDTRTLNNTLRKVGKNTLIQLHVAGESEPRTVLVREVQRDPIQRRLLHLDFQQISLTEKIRATVRVETAGECPDVRSGAGILLMERDTLEVECLPTDLVEAITIDISQLKVDDAVLVKDIVPPPGIRILEDPEESVLRITRFVEATVEEEAAGEPGEVEVIERGKKEKEGEEEEGE